MGRECCPIMRTFFFEHALTLGGEIHSPGSDKQYSRYYLKLACEKSPVGPRVLRCESAFSALLVALKAAEFVACAGPWRPGGPGTFPTLNQALRAPDVARGPKRMHSKYSNLNDWKERWLKRRTNQLTRWTRSSDEISGCIAWSKA